MPTRQQLSARRVELGFVLVVTLFLLSPLAAVAQERGQDDQSFVADLAKRIALDPTVYAPAIIAYGATIRDWNSSQPFFQNGFAEHNARFTISGRPDDVPVGYANGQRRILRDAFVNLQTSIVNNAVDNVIEHMLIARHPEHRKLFRTLGWIERISFASYMSYQLSADHFRQAEANDARARAMGLR